MASRGLAVTCEIRGQGATDDLRNRTLFSARLFLGAFHHFSRNVAAYKNRDTAIPVSARPPTSEIIVRFASVGLHSIKLQRFGFHFARSNVKRRLNVVKYFELASAQRTIAALCKYLNNRLAKLTL
jgi:hypothetical protein